MKKIIAALLTVFLASLLALLLGEILIRLTYPVQDRKNWLVADKKYGSLNRKNFYQRFHYRNTDVTINIRTNSLGLRDGEYDLTDTTARRVLLIGDSFTFGYGLDAEFNFDHYLEAFLNQKGPRYFVLNGGVVGWGTIQATSWARDHFELFRPDVIVFTFCGNDPTDDLKYKLNLRDMEKGLFYFPGKDFLRKHSNLYLFLQEKFSVMVTGWFVRKKVAESQKQGGMMHLDAQTANYHSEVRWEETYALILQFHRDFLKFNPKGVLLIQSTAPWDMELRTRLRFLDNERDLLYVDLYQETVHLTREELELPYDAHWSQKVHRLSAQKLFETIEEIADGRNGASLAEEENVAENQE